MGVAWLYPWCDSSEGEHTDPEDEGGRWAGDGRDRWEAVMAMMCRQVARHRHVAKLVATMVEERRT